MVINNTPQRPDRKAVLVSSLQHLAVACNAVSYLLLFSCCCNAVFFFLLLCHCKSQENCQENWLSQEIQIYTKVIISRDHDFYHVKYHVCVCTKNNTFLSFSQCTR